MKEFHFDSKVNYLIYKWRSAQLSDNELLSEMEEQIFKVKDKGQGLEGIIQIAIGEKQEGLALLKQYLSEESKQGNLECC